ncbi:hypothetical protein C5167_048794 [Papaver somniferum]|uniref:Sulfite exporter TauE/SafE family protein n=1 Tax=Papaver somniferum TaxID=3469 RepID=A0A4Y7KKD1_PAPSO|nr:hypothetical protein C5167_048794 [Papaver somniferum]
MTKEMRFGYETVVVPVMAFSALAFGSVGGLGGGIYVRMLIIVMGFDAKSSVPISKCESVVLGCQNFVFMNIYKDIIFAI